MTIDCVDCDKNGDDDEGKDGASETRDGYFSVPKKGAFSRKGQSILLLVFWVANRANSVPFSSVLLQCTVVLCKVITMLYAC